jgi:hypothetical protein
MGSYIATNHAKYGGWNYVQGGMHTNTGNTLPLDDYNYRARRLFFLPAERIRTQDRVSGEVLWLIYSRRHHESQQATPALGTVFSPPRVCQAQRSWFEKWSGMKKKQAISVVIVSKTTFYQLKMDHARSDSTWECIIYTSTGCPHWTVVDISQQEKATCCPSWRLPRSSESELHSTCLEMFVLRSHVSHAEQTGFRNRVFHFDGRVIGTTHDMPSFDTHNRDHGW